MKSNNLNKLLALAGILSLVTLRGHAQSIPADVTLNTAITSAQTIKATHSITLNEGFSADGANGTVELSIVGSSVLICNPLNVTLSAGQNYISTITPRTGDFTDASQLTGLSTCQAMQSIQYFDGLGRPLQTVSVKGNPDATKDVIQPFVYDQFGREAQKYLPYTDAGTAGSYRSNALTSGQGVSSFYNPTGSGTSGVQQGNGIVTIPTPYALTGFEPSPLNRPVEQGAPGNDWQPGSHTVKTAYLTNDATIPTSSNTAGYGVKLYTVSIDGSGNRTLNDGGTYAASQLNVTVSKDENWQSSDGKLGTTETYTDKEGHTVLKRTFNHNAATNQDEVLSTYYVYDDLNNLAFVLPPGASPDGSVTSASTATLNNFCYQYTYDERNRLTQKKIPGKGWEYMVYNKLDQVVFTQDSMQRANHQWGWTKYDAMGRVILTGIENNNYLTPDGVRGYVNSLTGQLWEDRTNSRSEGYTVYTHPQAGPENANIKILTINFYDDYTAPGLPSNYAAPTGASTMTRSLATANKTAILNPDGSISSNMLWSVHYYDDKGRNIKTYSQHYLGGVVSPYNYDEISTSYDFSNLVTQSVRKHYAKNSGNTAATLALTVTDSLEYDHLNRKVRTWEKINNGNNVVLNQTAFNEVGQLYTKKLHSADNAASFMQQITYGYNERGWMRKDSSSLFVLTLNYNTPVAGHGGTAQYNGNIAEQLYNKGTEKYVTYNYDKLNRLTAGNSQEAFSENGISYDQMGNIQSLTRFAPGPSSTTYSYSYSGNQLQSVSIPATSATFRTYAYDGNGNATSDGQGHAMYYNMLNLPDSIPSLNLKYVYDATGRKLRKISGSTVTEYINGIQYTGTGIDFVQNEEGRVLNLTGTPNYEYTLTDNLGNNRLTFDSSHGGSTAMQSDEYYPFGLEANRAINGTKNKYLYNKKELQDELGQYDYGARFYDPVIARWTVVDPAAELGRRWSPYVYGFDSPIRFEDPDGMWPDWGQVGLFLGNLAKDLQHGVDNLSALLKQNPAETVDNIRAGLKSGNIKNHIVKGVVHNTVKFATGTKNDKAAVLGTVAGEILQFGIPEGDVAKTAEVAEASKVGEAAKIAEVVDKTVEVSKEVPADVFHVTSDGVVIPKGEKYQIPANYIENPHRKSNYGVIEDGKYQEKLRIDPATEPGKKGPNTSHYHRNGKSTHYVPDGKDPGFKQN